MSMKRAIKRQILKEQGFFRRQKCPKCHTQVCFKEFEDGYERMVCPSCGWVQGGAVNA